jgi:hypothetical protein
MSTHSIAIDQDKKEAFAGRMVGVLNDASLALMVSVGHRTGLFDKMAELDPSTSEEIASATGLNERYVREWLGALVTGKVVDYDAKAQTYVLPREHAASLTRSAGAGNLASWLRFIPFVARVEDDIVDCFRKGGGVPYSKYIGFTEAMHEASSPMFDAGLMNEVPPMASELTQQLESGIDVLEVGCGTGHALMLMAETFPEEPVHRIRPSREQHRGGHRTGERGRSAKRLLRTKRRRNHGTRGNVRPRDRLRHRS